MKKKKMLRFLCFVWISSAPAVAMSTRPTQSAIQASISTSTASNDDVASASSAIAKPAGCTPMEDDEATASSWEEIKNQNPYVKASPLSVAAVCSDGVSLISLHYGIEDDFYDDDDDAENIKNANDTVPSRVVDVTHEDAVTNIRRSTEDIDDDKIQQSRPHPFRDLPISTRGPLRIEHVYSHQDHGVPTSTSQQIKRTTQRLPPPMAILTAGWRTDGMTLASAARELIVEERMLYCLPYLVLTSDGVSSESVAITHDSAISDSVPENDEEFNNSIPTRPMPTYYGRRIADGLSYYLAKCEFSESVRSLSTIGLLACGDNNNIDGEGSIFLIDATGAYRVRAHAIGAGASQLNRRMGYVDFRKISCREGLRVLLRLIAEEGGLADVNASMLDTATAANDGGTVIDPSENGPVVTETLPKPAFVIKQEAMPGKTHPTPRLWNLPQHTAVELAIIENGQGRMKRVRLATLDK